MFDHESSSEKTWTIQVGHSLNETQVSVIRRVLAHIILYFEVELDAKFKNSFGWIDNW